MSRTETATDGERRPGRRGRRRRAGVGSREDRTVRLRGPGRRQTAQRHRPARGGGGHANRGLDDLEEVFTNWRIHGTYSSASLASLYLPPAHVDAYLNAADRLTVLTLEVLAGRSEGGVLENRREAVMHRAAFAAMRKARSGYDAAAGRRRRIERFRGRFGLVNRE